MRKYNIVSILDNCRDKSVVVTVQEKDNPEKYEFFCLWLGDEYDAHANWTKEDVYKKIEEIENNLNSA